MATIREMIEGGPNRFSRILGHGTIDGVPVRLRVRLVCWTAYVEYTDATRENDAYHLLGGGYPSRMQFKGMLRSLPRIAQFELTPAMKDRFADELADASRAEVSK